MTQQERVSELWKILREDYGIETMEQFWEAYSKLPPIDITPFVFPMGTTTGPEHRKPFATP